MSTGRAQDPLALLTPRGRQIFTLIGQGYRPAEIGTMLGIARKTVNVHCERILIRLGLDTSTELQKLACATTTQRLRAALAVAIRDFATVSDLAGHATPAGVHAQSSIKRILPAAECAT